MKNVKFLSLFLALACWGMTACNESKPKDAEKVADKANDAKTETTASAADAELLVNAASADMFEIAAAQLAVTMSTKSTVVDFANQMTKAHTEMLEGTKALAAKKTFTLPTMMANTYITDMEDMRNWKKGKEFDTKYIAAQVKLHEKMLEQIEKQMADTKDSDIKMWTEKAAAGVRMHVEMAKKIDGELATVYK